MRVTDLPGQGIAELIPHPAYVSVELMLLELFGGPVFNGVEIAVLQTGTDILR